MKLTAEPFERIRSGSKTIEVRLFDEKRRLVNVGDEIEFTKISDQPERIKVKVTGLLRYATFADLFADFAPESFGAMRKEDLANVYEFYTKEQEAEFGVLGIKVKLISS